MVTRRKFLALMGGGAFAATAAAGGWAILPGAEKLSGDPRIAYGKEACDRCGMIISDPRFAGARRDGDSKERHYDDIGCMVIDSRELQAAANVTYFVNDFQNDGWLDATTAVYVTAPHIKSPMSYQLGAFPTETAARAFAERFSGTDATWDGLRADLKERG